MNVPGKIVSLISTVSCIFFFSLPATAGDTIKIGVAGAHSGDLASYGLPTVKATELVVNELNAKGGINGKKIELLIEDDVCKPEVATNTATKLVSQGVDVVIALDTRCIPCPRTNLVGA